MSQELTGKQIDVAILVAEDVLTNEEIAASAAITARTLDRWKKLPEFQSRVHEHIQRLSLNLERYSIARQDKRVAALDDRWRRMRALIDARAEALADEVAGGETGLLVRTMKVIGTGKNSQTITEYSTDTGLLSEFRAHEKQAAQEAGQWAEKREVTGSMVVREYIGIDPESV